MAGKPLQDRARRRDRRSVTKASLQAGGGAGDPDSTDGRVRAPGGRARAVAIAAAVVGLIIATVVIGYYHLGGVLSAMRPIGVGGFLVVIAAQVALFVPLGLAWRLVAPSPRRPAPAFMWGRLMREAASDVLPFSQVGGIVIAARCAVLGGVTTATAFGSCVVDITLEIVAQLIYTLIGVGLLAERLGAGARSGSVLLPMLGGIAVAAIVVGGFIFAQHRGLHVVERMVRRLVPAAADNADAVTAVVKGAYRKPGNLVAGVAIHVATWFGGAVGVWLILRFIGRPLPFMSVVAIESLLFAIRNAAFVVPSGLGVQEGAYAVLGPLFGLPAETALALSLLKRARDIAIGVPALLTWQFAESRRALRGG
jgi:glycosyltransferase 2 family protein